MLITKDFVLLNYPKTGSTFSRRIIRQVYLDDCEELLFPVAYDWRYIGPNTQHGTYMQIPEKHRNKPVLSIIRNPFDRYVSQYRFKWYAHSPPANRRELQKLYPCFPELEFAEFLDMGERFSKRNVLAAYDIFQDTDIGFQTISFIAFFSGNPREDLEDLISGKGDPFLRLPKVHFLHQESLREELASFLAGMGRSRDIEKTIFSASDMNVGRSSAERDFMQFWSPGLLVEYSEKERFLLKAFPEYRREMQGAGLLDVKDSPATGGGWRNNHATLNPAVVKASRRLRMGVNYSINLMLATKAAASRLAGRSKRYLQAFARH